MVRRAPALCVPPLPWPDKSDGAPSFHGLPHFAASRRARASRPYLIALAISEAPPSLRPPPAPALTVPPRASQADTYTAAVCKRKLREAGIAVDPETPLQVLKMQAVLVDKEREGRRLDFSSVEDLTQSGIDNLKSVVALKEMREKFMIDKPTRSKALYIKALLVQARRARPLPAHDPRVRQPSVHARAGASSSAPLPLPAPPLPRCVLVRTPDTPLPPRALARRSRRRFMSRSAASAAARRASRRARR